MSEESLFLEPGSFDFGVFGAEPLGEGVYERLALDSSTEFTLSLSKGLDDTRARLQSGGFVPLLCK